MHWWIGQVGPRGAEWGRVGPVSAEWGWGGLGMHWDSIKLL